MRRTLASARISCKKTSARMARTSAARASHRSASTGRSGPSTAAVLQPLVLKMRTLAVTAVMRCGACLKRQAGRRSKGDDGRREEVAPEPDGVEGDAPTTAEGSVMRGGVGTSPHMRQQAGLAAPPGAPAARQVQPLHERRNNRGRAPRPGATTPQPHAGMQGRGAPLRPGAKRREARAVPDALAVAWPWRSRKLHAGGVPARPRLEYPDPAATFVERGRRLPGSSPYGIRGRGKGRERREGAGGTDAQETRSARAGAPVVTPSSRATAHHAMASLRACGWAPSRFAPREEGCGPGCEASPTLTPV